MALGPPPRQFHKLALQTVTINPTQLFRVSRHDCDEPYFGRSGVNRFDDTSSPKYRRMGTCYFGLSLTVATAETILHDEMPTHGKFDIAVQEFENRFLVTFGGSNLVLADLTGPALKALAGDGSMSTIMPPTLPQQWSRAILAHPQDLDGILYMSRHINDDKAVVLFERAKNKLKSPKYQALPDVPGAARAAMALRIQFSYG